MTTQESIPAVEANAILVADDEKQLLAVVEQNHLQAETATSLQQQFAPLFAQARSAIEKSRGIVVTDANQRMEISMARVYRLQLKSIRVAGEKAKNKFKEESLRRGKAIDGFWNILNDLIATEEDRLDQQEKFAEVQEANRKAALKADREKVLAAIQVDPNLYQLGDMTEQTFQQLVEGTKLARAAEAERKRKEEAERIEREAKEQAERERVRLENERLKAEAAEKEAARIEAEKKAAIDRAMAEKELKRMADEKRAAELESARQLAEQKRIAEEAAAKERARVAEEQRIAAEKAKAEREAVEEAARKEKLRLQALAEVERQKAETARKEAAEKMKAEQERRQKLQDAIDAAAKIRADKAEQEAAAARKAAGAPDKDRLINYANAIRALDIPTFATPEAKAIATTIAASRDKFVEWIEGKAGAIWGSRHPLSKLDEETVLKIRASVSRGKRVKDVASDFGISPVQVTKIKNRDRWRHI